jgi:transposase
MKIQNQPTPILATEAKATIFVSIELSRKSWLIGIHTPLADKIGLHKLDAGDSVGLLALIRRFTEKVMQTTGKPVTVLSCYEAGYDGFWRSSEHTGQSSGSARQDRPH